MYYEKRNMVRIVVRATRGSKSIARKVARQWAKERARANRKKGTNSNTELASYEVAL
jgi:Tfp pilus assembly major pilin PilA